MSGIFGVLDSKRSTSISGLVSRMGSEMSHRDWYVAESYVDEESGIGLGRIGIGIFNQEQQPRCNEDQSLVVFLSGEFYATTRIRQELEKKGRRLRDESDLELALRLYEEKGEEFIHDLEGAFVLAIWNRSRQQLLIANDRFGLYPVHHSHYDGRLVFAPEMKGILCDCKFRKELDLTALAEYVRFQRLLGTKTFFKGIQLLSPASLLTYDLRTDRLKTVKYWDFSNIPVVDVGFDDAVDQIQELLTQATERCVSGPYRPGVYLSGGKDSRTILGLAADERRPMHSITFGAPDSRDVLYAQRIADRVGSRHHVFEYRDGKWVEEHADLHLELTEGFHNWVHLHGIDTTEAMREFIDVQLTGFCGDHLLDSRLRRVVDRQCVETWDTLAFRAKMFHLLCHRFSWPGLDEAEARSVFTPPMRERLRGRAFSSLKQELKPFEKYNPLKRWEFFQFVNHSMRLTHNYVLFYRSSMEVRYPFLDYAFFDFVCGLPPDVRFRDSGRLYRELLDNTLPELTTIPSAEDGRLLTNRPILGAAQALAERTKRAFNHYVAPIFPKRKSLYADYEAYLRTDLREWGESILFDKRTRDRGIFDPDFLHSLWDRHQSGRERHTIGKIAPIMTYEMMLRRFYD